ncbi:MAG: ATP-binding cassette domain-containing protein, partial [Candidatus Rokubacteria bacterium]|nr:ATP-binding cassette domain-containing protein [Candidatus Rokubacteria bacterium]
AADPHQLRGTCRLGAEGGRQQRGHLLGEKSTHRRQAAVAFLDRRRFARTTALENVALPLMYGPARREDPYVRARRVLAAVGLAPVEDHLPNQLSGGQQQRVAIARALVNEPALILADEPTGNLDTRTSVEIMAIFQQMNRQGMTVVLVTHETDIAEYATRVLAFRDGRLLRDQPVTGRRDAQEVLAARPEGDEP